MECRPHVRVTLQPCPRLPFLANPILVYTDGTLDQSVPTYFAIVLPVYLKTN